MRAAAVVGLAIVGIFALVVALAVFRPGPLGPRLTCALEDSAPCQDTYDSIMFPMSWALWPELDGVITGIHVKPAPPEWKDSLDEGFKYAEWAALLERWDRPPVLAACVYDSGDDVVCQTEERPSPSPSTTT